MQFKEALKAAGLVNPGRTTWCGIAVDGTPVFTIWEHEIRKVDGRYFAWWEHPRLSDPVPVSSPQRRGRAKAFVELAVENIGKPCRAVILRPRMVQGKAEGVESAQYPRPGMSRVIFRAADREAVQFIAELID